MPIRDAFIHYRIDVLKKKQQNIVAFVSLRSRAVLLFSMIGTDIRNTYVAFCVRQRFSDKGSAIQTKTPFVRASSSLLIVSIVAMREMCSANVIQGPRDVDVYGFHWKKFSRQGTLDDA